MAPVVLRTGKASGMTTDMVAITAATTIRGVHHHIVAAMTTIVTRAVMASAEAATSFTAVVAMAAGPAVVDTVTALAHDTAWIRELAT